MAAKTSVHFVPAGLDVPVGVVTQLVATGDDFAGWAAQLSDGASWRWASEAQNDPFHSRAEPHVATASSPDRNLDGARVREQLALFSGHGCDVWNGVLWPALIGLPELAAAQYLPANALQPLERQMLAIGVGIVQSPDILIILGAGEGFTDQEKGTVLRRLSELADAQRISVVLLSKPRRILIDQSAAFWLH